MASLKMDTQTGPMELLFSEACAGLLGCKSHKRKRASPKIVKQWAHVMITLLSMYRSLRGASLTK